MKQRIERIEALAKELMSEIRALRQELGMNENIPKNVPKILPQLEELSHGRKK